MNPLLPVCWTDRQGVAHELTGVYVAEDEWFADLVSWLREPLFFCGSETCDEDEDDSDSDDRDDR